ncbi:MAG: hypothetical protein MZV70_31255 [Desulfobacterales bacterium]|nr:hypothetical protein [Desulfobacterales bacterium]
MISGHELIKKYGIQDFELFNLIKSGLTAYSETGRRIVDIDTLPRKKKTLEEIEEEIRTRSSGAKNADMPPTTSGNKETIETNIKELALIKFKRQIGDPIYPPHCDMMDFTLPRDSEKVKKKLKEIKYFRFKLKDVSKFLPYPKVPEK